MTTPGKLGVEVSTNAVIFCVADLLPIKPTIAVSLNVQPILSFIVT